MRIMFSDTFFIAHLKLTDLIVLYRYLRLKEQRPNWQAQVLSQLHFAKFSFAMNKVNKLVCNMGVMLLYIVNKMEVGNAFDAFCESEASYLFSQECYIKHYVIRIIAQCILLKQELELTSPSNDMTSMQLQPSLFSISLSKVTMTMQVKSLFMYAHNVF